MAYFSQQAGLIPFLGIGTASFEPISSLTPLAGCEFMSPGHAHDVGRSYAGGGGVAGYEMGPEEKARERERDAATRVLQDQFARVETRKEAVLFARRLRLDPEFQALFRNDLTLKLEQCVAGRFGAGAAKDVLRHASAKDDPDWGATPAADPSALLEECRAEIRRELLKLARERRVSPEVLRQLSGASGVSGSLNVVTETAAAERYRKEALPRTIAGDPDYAYDHKSDIASVEGSLARSRREQSRVRIGRHDALRIAEWIRFHHRPLSHLSKEELARRVEGYSYFRGDNMINAALGDLKLLDAQGRGALALDQTLYFSTQVSNQASTFEENLARLIAQQIEASLAEEKVAKEPGAITPESIGAALDAITVENDARTERQLDAAAIFKRIPANTQSKAQAFRAVQQADKKLRQAQAARKKAQGKAIPAAEKRLEAATNAFEAAKAKLKAWVVSQLSRIEKDDALMRELRAQETEQRKDLATLKARKSSPQAAIDEAQKALDQTLKDKEAQHLALKKELEEGEYGPTATVVNHYTVTVAGTEVKFHDHVEAYATTTDIGVEGKGVGESHATVEKAIDEAPLGASAKKILKVISRSEGVFSTVNTWDKAVVTWGFIQWTGGDHSDLTAALTHIKKAQPAAFRERFQVFGIDVVNDQIVITNPDGTQIKGAAAAKAIQSSVKLTAVIASSAMERAIQEGQLSAAVASKITGALDRKITVTVAAKPAAEPAVKGAKKKPKPAKTTAKVRAGDVITSEFGVAVLADATVHGGFPQMGKKLSSLIATNGWDLAAIASWAAKAEQGLLPVIIHGWTDRAAAFAKAGCSKAPGSFQA